MPIIKAKNLSKIYRVYNKASDKIKELLSPTNKNHAFIVKAIDNVSFSIEKGDRIGILGENGSGKTTLLKILSHVLTPTSGTYYVNGKVSSLLELGTGFNSELTGKENFYQNGMVYGFTKKELNKRFYKVSDFAELNQFINQPVKNYSSGMFLRLAFSCAVFVDPDILIIDEALSVGDIYFQNKCYHQIKSLIDNNGTTLIYVSHNPDSIKSLCNKALMLRKGAIEEMGEAEHVSNYYMRYLYEKQNRSKWGKAGKKIKLGEEEEGQTNHEKIIHTEKERPLKIEFKISESFRNRVKHIRGGTGEARVTDVELINISGETTEDIKFGETVKIRVYIEYYAVPKDRFSIGVGIRDMQGIEIIHFFALAEGLTIGGKDVKREIIDFQFENKLAPGNYTIAIGLADMIPSATMSHYYEAQLVVDYCPGCYKFMVGYDIEKPMWGKVSIPVKIQKYSYS